MGLLESYLDAVENLWDVSEQEKQQELQRLKLLLKYELVLVCPVPVLLSEIEEDDKQQSALERADSAEDVAGEHISLTPALKEKVEKVAAKLNQEPEDVALKILSDGLGKYYAGLMGHERDEPVV